jgi:PAS domain S-box-containing protein
MKKNNLLKDKADRQNQTDNPRRENIKEILKASKERFRLLSEAAEEGVAIHDNGVIIEVNKACARMFQYELSDMIGMNTEKLATPESWMTIKKHISTGYDKPYEGIGVRKDGSTFVCSLVGKPYEYKGRTLRVATFSDITDRKRMEDDLRRSERYFKEITENTSDIIIITDEKGDIKYCSPSMERFAGYKPEEVIGKNAFKYIHPDEAKRATDEYNEAIQNRNHPLPPNSFRIIHKDGSIRYFDGTGKVLLDNQDIAGVVMNVHDITDRKRIEESLRASEEKFASAFRYSPNAMCISTISDGQYVDVNEIYLNILGYKREDLIDRTSSDINLWVDMAERQSMLKELAKTGKVTNFELRFRDKQGEIHWGLASASLIKIAGESYVLTQTMDTTELKKLEENLLMTQFSMDCASHNIQWLNDSGKIIYANDASIASLGYTREELLTMTIHDIDPDFPAEDWLPHIDKLKRQRFLTFESRHRKKDGSIFPVEVTCNYFEYKGRLYSCAFDCDITERRKIEDALLQEQQFSRLVIDNLPGIFYLYAYPENRLVLWNKQVETLLGFNAEDMKGRHVAEWFPPEYREATLKAIEEMVEKGQNSIEAPLLTKDGRQIQFSLTGVRFEVQGKSYFMGIGTDITERKQTDEAIKSSEEKYRLLADHMKDQVWVTDLDLKVSYVSPSVEKTLGYTLDELRELPLDKLLTSASFNTATDFFSMEMPNALAAPLNYVLNRSLELEFICKDGHPVWGETKFSFIRDENGKPLYILGEGREITKRKQIENALRKSEENFRRSLDDSPLGVRISTIEGKTLYANRAILDIYGYEGVEELENTPLQERYTHESYAEFQIRKKKRLEGKVGPSEYEVKIVRKDGEIRHLYVFRKEIFWNGNKQSQVIYQDITLRRQAEEKLNETLESLRQSIKITIQVLGTASEAKDPYMAGHQRRVADLARAIATEMKLPHDKIEAIRMASAIHDIGKISVPAEILCKPAILTELEFSLVKNHPLFGYEIMKEVESPWPLADIVHQHHERLDGSGYPQQLKNGDILIESRILAVADVVEAMVSYRPYRPALETEIALTEIEKNSGLLYDHNAVEACLRLFREKGYQIT